MKFIFVLPLALLFVTSKNDNSEEIELYKKKQKRKQFLAKYVTEPWHQELWDECGKGMLWDQKEVYLIFRAQIMAESRGKWWAVERTRSGYPISFGRAQNSLATCLDYRRRKRIPHPRDPIAWAKMHSIEVYMWKNRLHYKKYRDIKMIISMHNWGETGYWTIFRRRYPKRKYWISVDETRKWIPDEFKGIL